MPKSMKREGPAPVPAVTVGGVRYEVPHSASDFGGTQNGGYVVAVDVASGEKLWALRIYETSYDDRLERDVQDVFITALADIGGSRLSVQDEAGRSYTIDLTQRRVALD